MICWIGLYIYPQAKLKIFCYTQKEEKEQQGDGTSIFCDVLIISRKVLISLINLLRLPWSNDCAGVSDF